MKKTLFDKIWDAHIVETIEGGHQILYIDKHFIHEVTSPQAFAELEKKGLTIANKSSIVATADHNVPTINQHLPIKEQLSRKQVNTLIENCKKYDIELYGLGHPYQGIVHVIGPELGITQPGMTIVCGDSHTSTHGAFGSIAFGIGTSQVAQVMATQALLLSKPKKMRITVNGTLKNNVFPKDVILYLLAELGTHAGTGYFIEYAGTVFEQMSMEGRMTVCNMSIEMGARGGLIAPDETTFKYLKGRKFAPTENEFEVKRQQWAKLFSDKEAIFDKEFEFDAANIAPMLTYGTNPGMGMKVHENIPALETQSDQNALKYMGLKPGEQLLNKAIDYVFIGSCTNSRIEDFRVAADYIKGKTKADNVEVWVVPGSQQVMQQIKEEQIDAIFEAANIPIRQAGCSACLGMNEDKVPAGKYCVSTSNRNFEGRQGKGARTILASPLTAAAAAIEGKIIDVSHLN